VLELLVETGLIGLDVFLFLFSEIVRSRPGRVGVAALVVSLATAITQTVLFEPTWWFAAGLAIAGSTGGDDPW
jgi:hypothetical protein